MSCLCHVSICSDGINHWWEHVWAICSLILSSLNDSYHTYVIVYHCMYVTCCICHMIIDVCIYSKVHRENGGTLGMVPLMVNPIYTLYSGYLLGISPFKRVYLGLSPLPVIVANEGLSGSPAKKIINPAVTVAGRGDNPMYTYRHQVFWW